MSLRAAAQQAEPALLEARGLSKQYALRSGLLGRRAGAVRAVDGVSLQVQRGRTLGLAGESGCGKSTLARLILRLEEPDSGELLFDGQDMLSLRGAELRALRRRIQPVFQDPYGSLNPRWPVVRLVGDAMLLHGLATRRELGLRVQELLDRVGLPQDALQRYPHEFSGGQRQRIGIARALALRPELIVCDELSSALDVSVQAHILNLLQDLQKQEGLAYLFITHDLAVLRQMAHRVAVMYCGRIVEEAGVDELFEDPWHPYTQALLAAVPDPLAGPGRSLSGSAATKARSPAPAAGSPGRWCPFEPRCPRALPVCREQAPSLHQQGSHRVWCGRAGE